MKKREFIEYFNTKGYIAFNHYGDIIFEDLKGNEVLEIDSENNVYTAFYDLPFSKQQEYYKVIFEYLMTPPEEREEEKKYYLKLKHFNSLHNYLNLNINSGEYELSTIESTQQFKTKFTEKEIDDIPKGIKSHNWEYVEVI